MHAENRSKLVSIYMDEDARIDGKPVYLAVLEFLRERGAFGALAVRGIAGLNTKGQIQAMGVVALSTDLPIKLEWIDTADRVDAFLPEIKNLVPVGLITVQDVFVAKRATALISDVLNRSVSDVMTHSVVSVVPDTTLSEVVSLLLKRGHHSLPVVDGERKVVGIVTSGDLLRNTSLPIRLGLQSELTDEQIQSDIVELQAGGRLVCEIMSMPVVTIPQSATVRQAGVLMVDHDLKRLPVVDAKSRLVGVISRVDLLSAISAVHELEYAADEVTSGHTIAELMNAKASFVLADANLEEIVQALEHSRQQRVVVVDSTHQVVGVITDGDLLSRSMYGKHPSLRRRLRGLIAGTPALPFDLPTGHETAADLMTSPVITIRLDASLGEALGLMLRHQLKRLPVVDDSGRLIGVLGRSSVLRGSLVGRDLTDSTVN